jgi:hypothetical protein
MQPQYNNMQQFTRIADCRSSTPGRGERQWTNVANDSRIHNTGAPWMHGGEVHRVPIPSEPDILSDVEHRNLGRINPMQNARIFGESADAEYEREQAKEQAKRERRMQQEGRLLQMVSSKADYRRTVHAETSQALQQQVETRAAQQLDEDRHSWAVHAQGVAAENAASQAMHAQKSARRELAQQVAQDQLAQAQQRKSTSLVEREAEKRRVQEEIAQGMHWEARFGRSLR